MGSLLGKGSMYVLSQKTKFSFLTTTIFTYYLLENSTEVPSLSAGDRPATSWVHYTTSCNTQSSAPEDG